MRLYYLANRTAVTVATDLYSGDFTDSPAGEADPAFLKDPAHFAPFVYDRSRLLALPADGCYLPFRTSSFDAVYSLSSIEHFGGHERAAQAVQEMGRVLKAGGVACVATELVLEGGPHPAYFTLEHLYEYVIAPSGMSLVEPLAYLQPPKELMDDPVELPDDYLKTPHIVLQDGQWKFTSVCLFMRKPTHLDLIADWWRRHSGGCTPSKRQHAEKSSDGSDLARLRELRKNRSNRLPQQATRQRRRLLTAMP
jgi:SAM-dependent methyltransferase